MLNDNAALRGPWLDSLERLERVWLPRALDLGLRDVAHVVQANAHVDIFALAFPRPLVGVLELQTFDVVPAPGAWLGACHRIF